MGASTGRSQFAPTAVDSPVSGREQLDEHTVGIGSAARPACNASDVAAVRMRAPTRCRPFPEDAMRRGVGFVLGLFLALVLARSALGAPALSSLALGSSSVTGGT